MASCQHSVDHFRLGAFAPRSYLVLVYTNTCTCIQVGGNIKHITAFFHSLLLTTKAAATVHTGKPLPIREHSLNTYAHTHAHTHTHTHTHTHMKRVRSTLQFVPQRTHRVVGARREVNKTAGTTTRRTSERERERGHHVTRAASQLTKTTGKWSSGLWTKTSSGQLTN